MIDVIWCISQITLPSISFIFIEMKFICYHYFVIYVMKSKSICNE